MAQVDVQEVLKKFGVKTDVSAKWISISELEKLIDAVVARCASVADENSDSPSEAIKKEFKIE